MTRPTKPTIDLSKIKITDIIGIVLNEADYIFEEEDFIADPDKSIYLFGLKTLQSIYGEEIIQQYMYYKPWNDTEESNI